MASTIDNTPEGGYFAGYRSWMGAALAIVLSLACMFPILQNEWLNWDDEAYVLRNPMVWELDGEHVGEMFTTPEQVGLYHPLTMLSLAVDEFFWERDAFGFHLTNLLLHLLNVLLVFWLLRRLARRDWMAVFGAILFGMHPMHVESVAWISTRKDVLYTAFFLLAILAYFRYLEPERRRKNLYLGLVVLLFAAALLSKAIAFIFPLLLFLIDYHEGRKWSWRLLLEKIPFLVLAGAALWVATLGQQSSDSMAVVSAYPLHKTVFIGSRNGLFYLAKFFVPIDLSPFYPFSFYGGVSIPGSYYFTVIPWLLIGGVMWWFRKKYRPFVFGMAFFMVCMGPYLQILPYGKAITAERYTYVAYLGLFYLVGCLMDAGWRRWGKNYRLVLAGVAGVWMGWLAVQTVRYIPVWQDGQSLWSRVIDLYPNHYLAYLNRAKWQAQLPEGEGIAADLERTLALNPQIGESWYERGRLREGLGEWEKASADYGRAVELDPDLARAYLNRGLISARQRRDLAAAIQDFDAAIAADSDYALAYLNRGLAQRGLGNVAAAEADYGRAIALEPWNTVFRRYRGSFYLDQGDSRAAEADFSAAITYEPERAENWQLRGQARQKMGDPKAAADFEEARRLGAVEW